MKHRKPAITSRYSKARTIQSFGTHSIHVKWSCPTVLFLECHTCGCKSSIQNVSGDKRNIFKSAMHVFQYFAVPDCEETRRQGLVGSVMDA